MFHCKRLVYSGLPVLIISVIFLLLTAFSSEQPVFSTILCVLGIADFVRSLLVQNYMEQHSLEEKFKNAVDIVQNLPKDGPVKTNNDEKLMFYGLFKQATVGPCNTSRPGMFSPIERFKWDAWNKLGDLSKEEAMQDYVEKLLYKINEVEKTYDTKEWLIGDLFELMRPKFAVIGREYREDNEKEKKNEIEVVEAEEETSTDQIGNEKNGEGMNIQEIRSVTPNHDTATPASVLSDAEYCDAVEDEEQLSRSRSSSYEMQDSPRTRRTQSLKVYCERVEAELKKISFQIEQLNNAVEMRHSALLNIFKKATVYMFVPKGISWATVLFFFLWPFVAHVLMRYLGKWILRFR